MRRFDGGDCLLSASGSVLDVHVVLGGVASSSRSDQLMLSALLALCVSFPVLIMGMALDQVRLFRNRSVLIHLRIGCALHHYSVSCEKACTGP